MRLSIVAGAAVAACGVAGLAHASLLVYNPALGTLPQAQGWSFLGSYNAPTTVAGGQLTYGPTTFGGTTYWGHNPTDLVDFSSQTVFIEADIRLTGAGFGNVSGFRRGGFSLYLEDDFGRWIIAELGDNHISLGNDNNRTSDPVAVFDLTTDFHVVRLEAGPTGARLLVDGVQQLTLNLGSGGNSGTGTGSWGDTTVLSSANQTEVRRAVYIPAPGAVALGLATGLIGLRRRR